ncbi:hypothetical protein [Tengunoibacter tsumagoiensis]|uniref:Uncharacterized protein n=1 Tax=Tengunoibacter tsumagoiensis TaxID=2014871 RepID=A0A402A5R8_9CHLR|nr:hypothetical protein [Tengunoibacter tsumagoiensis]GCE14361.1 hypothetical protein KTT_42200 [Tengunoibacter tsumagoiensis]
MSQEPEKFLYFRVGLLKDSAALDALWQDALKHHMVDQPDKLIALRLTEYYELVAEGVLHPVAQVSKGAPAVQNPGDAREQAPMTNAPSASGTNHSPVQRQPSQTMPVQKAPAASQPARPVHDYRSAEDEIVSVIEGAEQNADAAADYWSLL